MARLHGPKVSLIHRRNLRDLEAFSRREGARAEEIAREHARIARRNLDIALENRDLLERLPGSTLLRLPTAS